MEADMENTVHRLHDIFNHHIKRLESRLNPKQWNHRPSFPHKRPSHTRLPTTLSSDFPMLSLLLIAYVSQVPRRVIPQPIENTLTILEVVTSTCTSPGSDRSVWDVVWGCLGTIFICTWVSVHPNIPGPDESGWGIAERRLKLMLYAVMAPELVIYWALRQWRGARQMEKMYSEYGWTKTHGHFLQMGGFMLFAGERRIEVLSCDRFKAYYAHGAFEFPTITAVEIQDRSKGDGLSKALAICQTTWFITQCITRKAQGFIITELEFATLAYAALNGVLYFFWWNKPLDVRCSIPVYLLPRPWTKQVLKEPGELADPRFFDQMKTFPGKIRAVIVNTFTTCSRKSFNAACNHTQEPASPHHKSGFLKQLLAIYEDVRSDVDAFMNCDTQPPRSTQISTLYAYYGGGQWQVDGLTTLLGLLFGAIHTMAWSAPFPSYPELILWRVSSIILVLTPLVMFIERLAYDIYLALTGHEPCVVANHWELCCSRPTCIPVLIFTFIYPFARLALITLAFTTLRSLTPRALANVQWDSILPHI